MEKNSSIESINIDRLPGNLKKHFHESFSVTFIENGECTLLVEEKLYSVQGGDVVLISGYIPHACVPFPGSDVSYKVIMISDEITESYNLTEKLAVIREPRRFPALSGISHFNLPYNCGEYHEEISEYLSGLLQAYNNNFSDSQLPCVSLSMKRIADYISAGWQRDITLDELSEISGLSKYHLVKRFRREFGMTPHSYSVNVRINRARILLKSDTPLADLSLDLGFYDQSHFCNTFLKYTGLTPLKYRKLLS